MYHLPGTLRAAQGRRLEPPRAYPLLAMTETSRDRARWLDRAAVALSALCVVHCLTLPLLVAGLPILAEFVSGHLHAQMLIIVVPLSVIALAIGYRRHRSRSVLVTGAIGMLLLIIGATLAHDVLGLLADRLFTISGAFVLAAAHLQNSLLARRCHQNADKLTT